MKLISKLTPAELNEGVAMLVMGWTQRKSSKPTGNDPHKEYPWLLGMMLQTRIVMASLELSQLKLPIQRIKE